MLHINGEVIEVCERTVEKNGARRIPRSKTNDNNKFADCRSHRSQLFDVGPFVGNLEYGSILLSAILGSGTTLAAKRKQAHGHPRMANSTSLSRNG